MPAACALGRDAEGGEVVNLDDLRKRLKKWRPVADGYRANCPAHDDDRQSLSIRFDASERIHLHCPRCTVRSIVAAFDRSGPSAVPPNVVDSGFEPFPVNVLPPTLRAIVEAEAEAFSVDPSFVAVPLLPTLAAAIGASAEIEIRRGFVQPSILWSGIIGPSGSSKSPVLTRLRKPLDDLQRVARKEYEKALRDYLARSHAIDARNKKALKDNPHAPIEAAPEKPKMRRFWVRDVTREALITNLAEQDGLGLLIASDELAALIRGLDQYKARAGADEAGFLELWNGDSISNERKTGEPEFRSMFIEDPRVSIAGGIQPATLRRIFTPDRVENGLFSRFLFAYPPPVLARWRDSGAPEEVERAYAKLLRSLSTQRFERWPEGGIKAHRLRLSADALELWRPFYETFTNAGRSETDEASGSVAKLVGYAARLALVLELARWAEQEEPGLRPDHVSAWAMEGAIRLVVWFEQEARRALRILQAANEEEEEGPKLMAVIRAKGGRITVRELQRRGRAKTTAAEAQERLQELVDATFGYWEDTGKRKSFRLYPPDFADVGTSDVGAEPSATPSEPCDPYASAERDAMQHEGDNQTPGTGNDELRREETDDAA